MRLYYVFHKKKKLMVIFFKMAAERRVVCYCNVYLSVILLSFINFFSENYHEKNYSIVNLVIILICHFAFTS